MAADSCQRHDMRAVEPPAAQGMDAYMQVESYSFWFGAKDYPNALALFQKAITLEPDAPDLYYYVGETYRGQGDYRSARDAYQEAINGTRLLPRPSWAAPART